MKRIGWVLVLGLGLTACGTKDADVAKQQAAALQKRAEIDREAARIAQADAVAARKASEAAQEAVAKLEVDVADLNARVDAAVDALAGAQSQADRDAANAKLGQLRKELAEQERIVADAKAASAKAARKASLTVSQECLDNPLAKGCS